MKTYLRWGPLFAGGAAAYSIGMALRVEHCRVGCVTEQVAHDTRLIGLVLAAVLVCSIVLALFARRERERNGKFARASAILAAIGLIGFVPWAIFDAYVELALNSET